MDGLEPAIRAATTKEEGVAFVDSRGESFATFNATGRTDIQAFTSEYEIFRGDLGKIILSPVEERGVRLMFNESIAEYAVRGEGGVTVTFATSGKQEDFDLLVAGDGLGSKIRGIMLNAKPRDHIHSEGAHVAFFTVNKDLLHGSKVAKWHNLPGGRVLFIRPDPHPEGRTRAHFMNVTWPHDVAMRDMLDKTLSEGDEAYKALMQEQFQDGDWICKEVLEGMHASDEFYCSQFAQVKAPKLQDGRVILVGDAGYATPGIGTSFALVGAYVLAGELLKHPEDPCLATKNYEEYMQKLVKSDQWDNNFMQYMNPQSSWGLWFRDTLVWMIAASKVHYWGIVLASKIGWSGKKTPLPAYMWPTKAA